MWQLIWRFNIHNCEDFAMKCCLTSEIRLESSTPFSEVLMLTGSNSNCSTLSLFRAIHWAGEKVIIPFNSRNIGTIFLLSALKMYNNVNNFDDKVGIIRNEFIIFVDFVDV